MPFKLITKQMAQQTMAADAKMDFNPKQSVDGHDQADGEAAVT